MKALIADDDEFFRIALRSVLSDRLGIRDVREAASLDEALEVLAQDSSFNLALMDLDMPGMESSASIGAVRELFPDVKVIVVSSSQRRHDILLALETGVHGYVPKGYKVDALTAAIRQIVGGMIYVPPSLADVASEPPERRATAEEFTTAEKIHGPALTPRQRDVLDLVVQGKSNKEIARALDLGEGTVKIHLAALFRNLGVRNRAAAAVAGAALLRPDLSDPNSGRQL